MSDPRQTGDGAGDTRAAGGGGEHGKVDPIGSLRWLWPFHGFAVFNAFFWSLLMGNPMVLFVRDLGADRALIGALASLHVLIGAIQLPAAPFAARYGYKRLALHSWALRTVVMTAVPFLAILPPSVSARSRLFAFTAIYIVYNLIRGVGVTAFMPWQAEVVPEPVRGRFFSRNQFGTNGAGIITLLLGSLILAGAAPLSRFAILFGFAVLCGYVSLYFIWRAPAPPSGSVQAPLGLVRDLRRTLADGPFMRIVWVRVGYAAAMAAAPPFLVLYLREVIGLSDSAILRYAAGVGAVQMLSILNWGWIADRFGSRPLFKVAVGAQLAFLVGWGICPARADGVLPWLIGLGILSGFGNSGVIIATLRYAVNRAPAESKAVALALQMVMFGMVMFVMPVAWGRVLDVIQPLMPEPGGEYRIFFWASAAILMVSFPLIRRLAEPDLAGTGQVLYFMIVGRPYRTAMNIAQATRHGVRWSRGDTRRIRLPWTRTRP